ncbi:MAG: LLM class F420-dependent oxidoreductase [Acidimicrobiales bacterium]
MANRLKLGLMTGYWGAGPPANAIEAIAAADELGWDSIWTAEAYGSDALTPLAWWGSQTKNVHLGTAIMQMAARTPTAAAMAAISMDHLSGGRFRLGLGASGPQVVEGWYGQPYPRPLERTREYIDIVRQVLDRSGPVTLDGKHYQLPLEGGAGLGKALKPTVHPLRNDLPIYLAAEGPKNVALAAEIADGWLPFWFGPKSNDFYTEALQAGFDKGGRHDFSTFDIACPVPIVPHPDVEAAANVIRPMLALYVGGMGAKGANFHFEVLARLGYESQCHDIQRLYLDGRKDEAIASIPLRMVEDVALVGPEDKIKEELPRWADTLITTLLVSGDAALVRKVDEWVNG